MIYISVCARALMRASVRERAHLRMHIGACVLACSLTYPACKTQAPYYVVCGLSGFTTIFDIISQTAPFSDKRFEHKMCVLIFSTNFI